jgi:signal transduction histidine kinase
MKLGDSIDVLRLWPQTLFGRLTLILFCGLIAAHALSFGLSTLERFQSSKDMMLAYLAKDIASSVAILERVPAAERPSWLERLERRNYKYVLRAMPSGDPKLSFLAEQIRASLAAALGPEYPLHATAVPGSAERIQIQTHLHDGDPLVIELTPSAMPLSAWLPLLLLLQLAVLAGCTWLAVRQATRPLARLAQAADSLGPDLKSERLKEDGPLEVARAAAAFNAMQARIAEYLAERAQILAAVSHDLQTPITRMRLRADLMDDDIQQEKLYRDLDAMQALVQEGIAYARSAQSVVEPARPLDIDALLESMVYDYHDAGKTVRLSGRLGRPIISRPNALRRIVSNLLDNALRFAQDVEIAVDSEASDCVSINVLDNGPGIPEDQLTAVLTPFYRVENSRSRDSGGTGLGLAIVNQLVTGLGGTLILSNRDCGGLRAQVAIPARC